ncbi:MAG: RAMP superfamily CRISPR-associated protein [Nanoarchaeota archaeon]|nr:RAMP superfamily CRISPR-associated protein [Nanoarchaeota archaeon]
MENVLKNRVVIKYKVVALSDMHIGGQSGNMPAGLDNPIIKDNKGKPFVPGSSLKGVLRSSFERLAKGAGIKVCDLDEKRGGCGNCPPCLLFGGGHKSGAIKIRDAFITDDSGKHPYIRDGVRIDRKSGKAASGAKYDIEVVQKGAKFEGGMVVENTATPDGEYTILGGLLSLIDFFNEFVAGIGGGTSKGMGHAKLAILEMKEFTANDYLEGKFNGKALDLEAVKTSACNSWMQYLLSRLEGKNEISEQ